MKLYEGKNSREKQQKIKLSGHGGYSQGPSCWIGRDKTKFWIP